jgi:hypothetical protein
MTKTVALLALTGLLTLPLPAQQMNLSGSWKINLAKSALAGDHPLPGYELRKEIEQKGSKFVISDSTVHASMFGMPIPDSTVTNEYVSGEKMRRSSGPCPFGIPPSEIQIAAEQQGGTLLITEVGGCFGIAATTERRYFLSADGAQLNELINSRSSFGDTEQRLVFDRRR